eukprot:356408-Chlamydomonas_euryale.AAC.1
MGEAAAGGLGAPPVLPRPLLKPVSKRSCACSATPPMLPTPHACAGPTLYNVQGRPPNKMHGSHTNCVPVAAMPRRIQ